MTKVELRPCPFCGGRFRWHYRQSIGSRMIRGYAKCDGCGCKLGDDLVAFDDGDLREDIARLANARQPLECEATCPLNIGRTL